MKITLAVETLFFPYFVCIVQFSDCGLKLHKVYKYKLILLLTLKLLEYYHTHEEKKKL